MFKKIDYIGIAGAIITFISLFLPYTITEVTIWGTTETSSGNFFDLTPGNATIIIVAVIVFIIIAFLGIQKASILAGLVTLFLGAVIVFGTVSDISSGGSDFGLMAKEYPGFGFYIFIAGICIMSFSWLVRLIGKKVFKKSEETNLTEAEIIKETPEA